MIFKQIVLVFIFFTVDACAMFRRHKGIGSPRDLAQLLGKFADDMAEENAPWSVAERKPQWQQNPTHYSKRKDLQRSSRDKRPKKSHTKFR